MKMDMMSGGKVNLVLPLTSTEFFAQRNNHLTFLLVVMFLQGMNLKEQFSNQFQKDIWIPSCFASIVAWKKMQDIFY